MSLLGKLVILFQLTSNFVGSHADENLSITQFIEKYNYPTESHSYETKDGYILTAQRIPHGVSNQKSKHVALLAHGMGGSAENYIFLGPPDALAFYLSDRGYDVWLFNARGTVHSRKHTSLNPNRNRKKFWDFSWHEIAVYDLPATIDYILNVTSAESLFYVGHSQGTTSLFVMLSELPEMNEKIKVAGLLAPSAHLSLTRSPLLIFVSRLWGLGQRLLAMFNWHEMAMPNSPMLNNIIVSLCRSKSMQDICMDIIYAIGGTDSGLINKVNSENVKYVYSTAKIRMHSMGIPETVRTLLPVILPYAPSGFAVRQVWHYAQVITTGEFKQYDFGKKKNMKLYNDTKPPLYNLSNCKAPLALFYAVEDPFGNPRMIEKLMETTPNVALQYQVPVDGWNHLDYLLASNVKEVIHNPLYEVFKQYEGDNEV